MNGFAGPTVDIDFAFAFDARGRTAKPPDLDNHVRDLIEQLLFTSAGERVNRPDFGSGVLQLVFAPASSELAATLQYTTQAAVQRWLGDVIDLHDLQVAVKDSTLRVDIVYSIRATGAQQTATFEQPV